MRRGLSYTGKSVVVVVIVVVEVRTTFGVLEVEPAW